MPAAGHQPGDGAHKRPGQSQRGTRWLEQVNTCCRDISTVKFAMILLSKIRNVVLVWCQDSPGWSNRGTRWFKQDPGFVQTSFLDPVFSTHSKLSLCSLYCILIKVSLLVTIFKQPPIELVIYGHPPPHPGKNSKPYFFSMWREDVEYHHVAGCIHRYYCVYVSVDLCIIC